jgi:capsular exopolysaccharide synthesis family protein
MADRRERSEEPSIEIDIPGLYYALREQIVLIVICVVLALIGAIAYLLWAPKMYRSQAIVQIEQAERKVVKIEDLDAQNLQSIETLKTLEMNLSNWVLIARVAKDPRLHLTGASLGLPNRPSRPYSPEELVEQLAKRITVSLVRGTRLITIDAVAADPVIAGMLPNLIVEEHKKMVLEEHEAVGREASRFLVGEVNSLKEKLDRSKKALQEYRENTKAVSLEDSRNTVDASLRELNAKLTEAKTVRLRIESDYAQIKVLNREEPESLLRITTIANAPAVLEQKKFVAAQEAEIANRSRRYLPKHPRYIEAQSKLAELKEGLNRAALSAADGIGTEAEAARATEAKIEEALHEQEAKSLELGRLAIGYDALVREMESDNALYQNVLSRLKETDVMRGIHPEIVRVVQPSATPGSPSSPRRKLVLLAALAAGLAVGGGGALVRIVLDRSLKTVDQAESFLGLSVLGSIPRTSRRKRLDPLPVLHVPHGATAESFRTLRTSLALLGEPGQRRTYLFTSAVQGEGKSFTASNFAIALAQQGLRTLLVDADLRLPSLARIFFEHPAHPGLADVLEGRLELAKGWRETETPNLAVMTAGNRPHHTAELLAGPAFDRLLKDALGSFDCVVVDTAPVNAVSDTLLLVKSVQSVCLVVHSTRTPRKAVARARNKLREAGARIAGVVLNQLPSASGSGYHYHYSPGAYGEGVYGAPERDPSAAR